MEINRAVGRSEEDSAVELLMMIVTDEKAHHAFFFFSFDFTTDLTAAFGVKSQLKQRVRFRTLGIAIKTHASSRQHVQICPNQSDDVRDLQLKRE